MGVLLFRFSPQLFLFCSFGILRFLSGLPDYLDLTVGRQDLHLVNRFPGHSRGTRIWGRVDPDSASLYQDTVCTIGHTHSSI